MVVILSVCEDCSVLVFSGFESDQEGVIVSMISDLVMFSCFDLKTVLILYVTIIKQ